MGNSIDACGRTRDPCCVAPGTADASFAASRSLPNKGETPLLGSLGDLVLVHPVGTILWKHFEPMPPLLGEGLRAKVRKCRERRLATFRACKSFFREALDDEKLRRELELMADLQVGGDNAHILRLFEVFEDSVGIHLILELCTGGELYDRQAQLGIFSETEAAELFRQMLVAVAHMHSRGIVHRDLRLENWMLVDQLKLDIRLGSFSLSVYLPAGTLATEKVGSPYYVAPEVLQGAYDYRADLWSLGVMLFMLLSGSPPFDGQSPADILEAVRAARLSFASRCWVAVPQDVRELVVRLLSVNPALRPTAADTLRTSWLRETEGRDLSPGSNLVSPDVGLASRRSRMRAPSTPRAAPTTQAASPERADLEL